ncbi:MAG: hypothetical protein V4488_23975 [Pseudomonadota bacterium]
MNASQKTPLFSKLIIMLAKEERHSPVISSKNIMRLLTEAETIAISGGPESEVGDGTNQT